MSSSYPSEIAAARTARDAWQGVPLAERLRHVRALRHLIATRVDDLIAAVQADIGRPAIEVVATELLPTAAALKFLERRARRILKPVRIPLGIRPTWLMGCRDVIHRRPWGVVGVIGTWNYPIYLNVGPIIQAVAAGNAVLWKPSETAARSADLVHGLILEAGFPPALVGKLPATRDAGPRLAEAEIDYLVFTGSDAVGRVLAAHLGERLIPSTLELSGCDAMFVLGDADIELAARGAWFGMTLNRGQTCIAVRRIFIDRRRQAAFIEAIRKLGTNSSEMKLVTPGQAVAARRLIDDARARGARLLQFPGRPNSPDPTSMSPTLLLDVPADAAIQREACFAPVAAVIPFDSLDEAIGIARQCPFGLGSSIFTRDTAAAMDLAARIPAGSVVINDVLAPTAHPATPFGGRGDSGWGVTQGAEGLLAMTVPQVVTVHRGTFRPHFDEAVSPRSGTGEMLRGLLRWTHARGLREKLRGLRQMIAGEKKK